MLATCALLLGSVGLPSPVRAEAKPLLLAQDDQGGALLDLPIEQLMNIEVTSVSKRPERLAGAAAAIHVITQEDIARSGMTSLPELLRMAPGLDVARADARHWAISSRGLNDIYSSKLLVLVDGRSVYTPLFSGVLWDEQVVPVQNIERIEVIRGPGATLWGANAVNGVINITTKNAADTQGLTASVTGGGAGDGVASLRYGGRLSDTMAYRVTVEGSEHAESATQNGEKAGDRWREGRIVARLDWTPSADDTVLLQGQSYREQMSGVMYLPSLVGPSTPTDTVQHSNGAHVLVNWNHRFSATSDLTVQAYYDGAKSQDYTAPIVVKTYDLEIRHHLRLGDRHDVVWGGGYRSVSYVGVPTPQISLSQPRGNQETFNAFAQDAFELAPPLHLTGGVKVEHNTYVDWEVEPSLRLTWEPAPNRTLWAAVSKAVRVPSIAEEYLRFNISATPATALSPPVLFALSGLPGESKSERLTAWEIGYRGGLTPDIGVDVSLFYNHYTGGGSLAVGAPFFEATPGPPHLVVPLHYGNLLKGDLYGAEMSATWRVTPQWKLTAGGSLLRGNLETDDPSADPSLQANTTDRSPRGQLQLHSHLDLPHRTQFDAAIYHVGKLPAGVSAYTRLDLRFAWRPTDHLTFSLAGQNLLESRHQEFLAVYYATPKEIPRAAYLTATMDF